MHLDCVFSILGDDCCLMLDEMMGPASPSRRLVDEWARNAEGRYECTRRDVEFAGFMEDEGYHIIPIAAADQLVRGVSSEGFLLSQRMSASRAWHIAPGNSTVSSHLMKSILLSPDAMARL